MTFRQNVWVNIFMSGLNRDAKAWFLKREPTQKEWEEASEYFNYLVDDNGNTTTDTIMSMCLMFSMVHTALSRSKQQVHHYKQKRRKRNERA